MTFPARIDVHQHIVPPLWAETLAAHGLDSGGWAIPAWSPTSALAMMDQQGIAAGVLSVTSPGIHLGSDAQARDLARAVNEYGADVVRDHPGRFGHFASVPLPDVDAALAETAHALDTLGADGVVLMSNAHGRYLGDPDFEPLWAELDRRGATVFVHPRPAADAATARHPRPARRLRLRHHAHRPQPGAERRHGLPEPARDPLPRRRLPALRRVPLSAWPPPSTVSATPRTSCAT
ncbi:hypothetical protein SANTM175S_10851 [Streptomyces antimycoticus]